MLTLLLLRHAKAEASGRGDDRVRPLTQKGTRDAVAVGEFLVEHRLVPIMALVSTALRTEQSYDVAAAAFATHVAVHREDDLYNADVGGICRRIAGVDEHNTTLLVVAHNPGIMEAALALAHQGDLGELERLRGRFPPGALAVIGFEAEDWADACSRGGPLDALIFPEDVGA